MRKSAIVSPLILCLSNSACNMIIKPGTQYPTQITIENIEIKNNIMITYPTSSGDLQATGRFILILSFRKYYNASSGKNPFSLGVFKDYENSLIPEVRQIDRIITFDQKYDLSTALIVISQMSYLTYYNTDTAQEDTITFVPKYFIVKLSDFLASDARIDLPLPLDITPYMTETISGSADAVLHLSAINS